GNQWMDLQSAKCDSDKFTTVLKTGGNVITQPKRIRCVRRKCAFFMNPCTNCPGTPFTASEKWDQCSEFFCGKHTCTIFVNHLTQTQIDNAKLICKSVTNNIPTWNVEGMTINVESAKVECKS
ncbi:hypothetical protein PENTCL1PPCAC_664, partial [Pristionchus entomophagus]